MRPLDLSGIRFGRLTAIRRAPNQGSKTCWLCHCDCGTSKIVTLGNLRGGQTRSCGCLIPETSSAAGKKAFRHGEGHDRKTPEYRAWTSMRERCLISSTWNYADYGGRGIRICRRWNRYEYFLQDMGRRPSDAHSLDRRNVDGPYSPKNCRWATRKEQQRNRRVNVTITFDGECLSVAEWAERKNLPYETLRHRIKAGWEARRALTTPVPSKP